MAEIPAWRKYAAEFFGTFLWVFLGTAAIVASGGNVLVIALAFGLALTGAYVTFSHVSGGHFNPAVTIALWLNKKIELRNGIPYIVAQLVGAVFASAVLYFVVSGQTIGGTAYVVDTNPATQTTLNTLGANLMGAFAQTNALVVEIVAAFAFVLVYLGITSRKETETPWAGMVLGLGFAAITMATYGFTTAAINPARAFGPAVMVGGEPITQLWVFFVAPIIGGIVAAFVHRIAVLGESVSEIAETKKGAKAKTTA